MSLRLAAGCALSRFQGVSVVPMIQWRPHGMTKRTEVGVRVTKPAVEQAPPPTPPEAVVSAREAIQETRQAGPPVRNEPTVSDADASPDDPDADDEGLGGAELLQRELGASVIEEINHS